jgi:hypothetical protein
VLNDFLQKEFELSVVFGTEFAYNTCTHEVMYTLFGDENSNNLFMKNFNRLAPDIDCDVFLASLMHEVGHHYTIYLLEVEEEDYCSKCKHRIEIESEHLNADSDAERLEELHMEYFNLPDEYEATMWAIAYIRNNIEKVREFWSKVQDAIMEFYVLNGVEI